MDATAQQLITEHRHGLLRQALRLTRHRSDAEDLVQDVCERALRSMPADAERPAAWLRRVLVNLHIDRVRRAQRRTMVALPGIMTDERAENDPLDRLVSAEFSADVERALDLVSPKLRIVLLLCDVDGYERAEVAQMLGISPGTVGSRLSRGRASMRAALNQVREEQTREDQTRGDQVASGSNGATESPGTAGGVAARGGAGVPELVGRVVREASATMSSTARRGSRSSMPSSSCLSSDVALSAS